VKLTLEVEKREWRVGEAIPVRLIAYNEAYEAAELDRRLLVGPTPVPARPGGPPLPVSLEPAARRAEQNTVLLNPWCFYGRQRVFESLPAGTVTVYGYLLRRAAGTPTATGPADAGALLAAAEPLELTIV